MLILVQSDLLAVPLKSVELSTVYRLDPLFANVPVTLLLLMGLVLELVSNFLILDNTVISMYMKDF